MSSALVGLLFNFLVDYLDYLYTFLLIYVPIVLPTLLAGSFCKGKTLCKRRYSVFNRNIFVEWTEENLQATKYREFNSSYRHLIEINCAAHSVTQSPMV